MDVFLQCGEFLANMFIDFWNAFGTWGVIGVGIIAPLVIKRVVNLVKRIFEF